MTLAELNRLSVASFVAELAGIFEHSPWVPEAAAAARPFADVAGLHTAMVDVVVRSGEARQLALLRAHPMLARRAKLTAESESEQAGHGLQSLDDAAAEEMERLNQAYLEKFGFPFIIAVRGQRDRDAIMQALRRRLGSTPLAERQEALAQVAMIAKFRLEDRVT